jgi:predicted acetyltransferase
MQLLKPENKFKKTYLSAIEEYHSEGFLNDKISVSDLKSDFEGYIKKIEDWSLGYNLPIGFSPQSEFWLIDNNEYIGTLKIRHLLNNETLSTIGGHIGYFIRPSKRKLGYGHLILKLGLLEVSKINLEKVLITCDFSNIGSKKIIESNGGIFEGIIPNPQGEDKCRYWINTN